MVVEQPSTTIHLCPSAPNKSLYYSYSTLHLFYLHLFKTWRNTFPDLQVFIVRIERLVSGPSDMLAETDMPRAAEAYLTEPFRAFLN
jgi:hypothetical protein